jgi:predicted ArsR family transcriptional regulator
LACWDYCERCAAYLFSEASGDSIENVIAAKLKERGKMSRNDLMNVFGRHKPSAAIQAALDALLKEGKVQMSAEATDGRSAQIWEWAAG